MLGGPNEVERCIGSIILIAKHLYQDCVLKNLILQLLFSFISCKMKLVCFHEMSRGRLLFIKVSAAKYFEEY